MLFHIVHHLCRPCASKVDALKLELKAMSILKYPGENISLFNVDAIKKVKEIQMNFVTKSQDANLTRDTITCLYLTPVLASSRTR